MNDEPICQDNSEWWRDFGLGQAVRLVSCAISTAREQKRRITACEECFQHVWHSYVAATSNGLEGLLERQYRLLELIEDYESLGLAECVEVFRWMLAQFPASKQFEDDDESVGLFCNMDQGELDKHFCRFAAERWNVDIALVRFWWQNRSQFPNVP